jgi:hypothetical protein
LQPVHNIFLLFLSQTGILLTGFVGFVFYKIHAVYKKKISFMMFSYIFVVVITGMFDHYWLTLQQNFLVMGVVGGMILQRNSRKN